MGKKKLVGDQIRCDRNLIRLKDEHFSEREKSRRINLDLARTKHELESANKWTHSSMIVTQLSSRTHKTKAEIGFVKEIPKKNSYFVHILWYYWSLEGCMSNSYSSHE